MNQNQISAIEWHEIEDGEKIILNQYDYDGEEIGHICMTRETALELAKAIFKNYEVPL